jgi:adenylate cyclase
MTTERAKRKLSAILSADVKGYSRLMGEDEVATVRTLKAYRELMSKLVREYRGRVVDSPGDNVLAEFGSVVDALECSIEIQKTLKDKNAELPENRRMEFRIGVNLGDVIEDEDRVYGDGVNIAARIEGLAEAGGICISGSGFEQVRNKLPLGYRYLGEHTVKNIAQPIKVYRVLTEPESVGKVIGEKAPRRIQWRLAAVVAIILVAGTLALWNFYFRPPPIEPASRENMAFPLPDKPSIAVLPFVNVSGDQKEDYFSDGLTGQIISSLSTSPRLFVIARQSVFSYQGKAVKVQQVAEELGVQYVLEGSVQKSGDKLRITAQLIDAMSGRHVWSERYDRELRDVKDLFDLQDEITISVMNGMSAHLTEGEQARLWTKRGVTNLKALEKHYQAQGNFCRHTREDYERARPLFEEAIALDPKFVWPYVYLGYLHATEAARGWSESPAKSLQMALGLAEKALAIDDSHDGPHSLLAFIWLVKRQPDKALSEAERALALNPNSSDAYMFLGQISGNLGRWEESVAYSKKSLRLSPFPGAAPFATLGRAYFMAGQYDESIVTWKKALKVSPNYRDAYIYLAACYSSMGRDVDAAAASKQLLEIDPKFTIESYAKGFLFRNQTDGERLSAALRKAGLPDKPPLPLPDKPSIAVLPFVNMSDDKSQEYFSDGLTEEIINALVKLPQVFVIARNSTFTYKGKSVDVRQVGREMGVKYVLEGSVRREGERIRVTAQLVDATTGNHLFSERYDREVKDLFALQDDITMKVMTSMRVQLTEGDYARAFAKGTKSLDAYLKAMQSYQHRQVLTKEGQARARQLAEEAIALDPGYAMAYCHLAAALGNEATAGVYKNVSEVLARSMDLAQKAVALDDSLAQAHITLGFQYTLRRDFDRAIAEGERAVALEPNSAEIVASLAAMLEWADRPEEAMPLFKKAMRLSPIPQPMWLLNMASAHIRMGQYEESIPICRAVLQKQPDQEFAHIFLAIAYISTGREQEARAEAAEILRVNPQFSWERRARGLPRKNQDEMKRRGELLLKAGLQE